MYKEKKLLVLVSLLIFHLSQEGNHRTAMVMYTQGVMKPWFFYLLSQGWDASYWGWGGGAGGVERKALSSPASAQKEAPPSLTCGPFLLDSK